MFQEMLQLQGHLFFAGDLDVCDGGTLYVSSISGCTSSGITIPTTVTIGDGGDTGNNGNLIVNEKIWLTNDGTTHSPAIYWGSTNDNFEISRPDGGLEMQVFGITFSEGNLSGIQSMDVRYDVTISGDTKIGGDITLENSQSIRWKTNPAGVYSNVLTMDSDNKTHINGGGGGFQIDDGGGIPQFSIDNGLGINSNATFEGNVHISGNTKLEGNLDLCDGGTLFCF